MQLQPLSGKNLHFITNRKYNALRLFSKTRKKKSTYKFSIESADGGISVSQIESRCKSVSTYDKVSTLTSLLSSFLQSSFFSVDAQGSAKPHPSSGLPFHSTVSKLRLMTCGVSQINSTFFPSTMSSQTAPTPTSIDSSSPTDYYYNSWLN